jgi:NDP-sugar pyrophosphorylase family protein
LAKIPKIAEFFPEINGFEHADIFGGIQLPWEALSKINGYIQNKLSGVKPTGPAEGIEVQGGADPALYCVKMVKLEADMYCDQSRVFIKKGTKIEPGAFIRGPAIIGNDCEVRQSAYLRGDFITGDVCTLGHATEIKGSIIMDHSEMGHFNYIGDSIIGSYVNVGAGTKLANLKFRSIDAKKRVEFPEIRFVNDGKEVRTGISKFGAVIGDYCELGCNSVVSPAVMLGSECWVSPNATIPSGVYPARSFLAPERAKLRGRPLPK